MIFDRGRWVLFLVDDVDLEGDDEGDGDVAVDDEDGTSPTPRECRW
jgi:hypothetical protein